jgi:glycerol-3-phosphate acyltransferase PlsY
VDFACHIAAALAAYTLGSIPTGYLVARVRGVDIRSLGSGNIGATNVFRFLGRTAGSIVLAADFLKGWVACAVVAHVAFRALAATPDGPTPDSVLLVAAVAAVLGHNYTCWLRFRGGKGIATSAGVLAAVVPLPFLCILIVWLITFAVSRFVSLASILAALALPVSVWIAGGTLTWILVTAGLAALAVGKHRTNIQRLIAGTEHRFTRAPGKPSP